MRKYLLLAAVAVTAWHCHKTDISEPGNLVARTTTEDPQLPALEINGARLHLETFGDLQNPILIFVHGGPGGDYRAMISEKGLENAAAYPNQRRKTQAGLTRLKDRFFCVFFDQRGAGLSPRFGKGETTIDHYIADLDAIINHFLAQKAAATGIKDGQVFLFGWSFGGFLSTAYINTHPSKVKDVILYEPRPFTQEAFDLLTLTSPFQQLNEDYVDEFLTGSTYLLPNDHAAMDYQQSVGATGNFFPEFNSPANLPFWRYGFVVNKEVEQDIRKRDYDAIRNLSQFKGRLLYLYGAKTKRDAIKPGFIELITAYYPRANAVEIPDTGHAGVWEKATEVVDAIRQFL
jgi:proline iminopeptidase